MTIDKELFDKLLKQAADNPRRRQNLDLRTSSADTSQRMLNALLPGTEVAIHRHAETTETVICLMGKLDEVFYEAACDGSDAFVEVRRVTLCPAEGSCGCQIPQGMWHNVEVREPSVLFEAKDGAYMG